MIAFLDDESLRCKVGSPAEPTVPRLQRGRKKKRKKKKKAVGNSLGLVEHEADFVLTGICP